MSYLILSLTGSDSARNENNQTRVHGPQFTSLLRQVLSTLAALDIEDLRILSTRMQRFGVLFDIVDTPHFGNHRGQEPRLARSMDGAIYAQPYNRSLEEPSLPQGSPEAILSLGSVPSPLLAPGQGMDSPGTTILHETREANQSQLSLGGGDTVLEEQNGIQQIAGERNCLPLSPSTNGETLEDTGTRPPSRDGAATTRYLRAYRIMTDTFGEKLKPSSIISAIKAGDDLIRKDAIDFLQSHLAMWAEKGIWDQPLVAAPTVDDSNLASFIKLLRCADVLERSFECYDIQLRVAQVLLYRHYERFLFDVKRGGQAVGRRLSAYTVDFLLRQVHMEEWDQMDEKRRQGHRRSLQDSKAMGKRWLALTGHFGYGILLICGKGPARVM
ncbi:uncharacterized protein GIQ15_03617 [Arthroderma uncinatum]|uniref:uncharacterized protein n=1 Tax=Arthroderma uncinatum TaxID=74035 RepID=UPI00144AB40B|nr:uncharacterized protein GIQ15_03617 [Arthroderma uncinatum]KAF3484293.1 hypothetical protein GIQ15_03617 [Arthroderma uncinatum]